MELLEELESKGRPLSDMQPIIKYIEDNGLEDSGLASHSHFDDRVQRTLRGIYGKVAR